MRKYQAQNLSSPDRRSRGHLSASLGAACQKLETLWCGDTRLLFCPFGTARTVVALISFDEHADPEAVTREYMEGNAFKKDMHGFDVTQIEGVDMLLLEPGEGSPLS